ncbi:hypothetical protein BC829DRAFT_442655 [Chytridium lagenaria]|nr:hypothetical protein BC829DRAFT_442655 [Chytridium lagenaria]
MQLDHHASPVSAAPQGHQWQKKGSPPPSFPYRHSSVPAMASSPPPFVSSTYHHTPSFFTTEPTPPNTPPSLISIASRCLERNINTLNPRHNLGEVPVHLMLPILKRSTFTQLETLLAHHPTSHPDYDPLYRHFVIQEFTDIRRLNPDTVPPPYTGWRDLLFARRKEREVSLARAKRHLEKSRREAELERERKRVMMIERPLDVKNQSSSRGWNINGNGPPQKNHTIIDDPPRFT